ncbi:MAG: cytochrome P450 [Isosphaeraceae bacterium]|nr:cytochrome P450 [Isosphaeraceae bacterium]
MARPARVLRALREYGDCVPIRLGPQRALIVNRPELVEEVLVTNNRSFVTHFALRLTKTTLGDGFLTSEGDFQRRQRNLTQLAFRRERTVAYADRVVALGKRKGVRSEWHEV